MRTLGCTSIVVGDINVDLIIFLPSMRPVYGQEIIFSDFELRGAGSSGYFAMAISKLGMKCCFVGKVGSDFFGQLVLQDLEKTGVNTSNVTISDWEKTGITISMIREGGERALLTFSGTNSTLSYDEIAPKIKNLVIETKHLHLGSLFLLRQLKGNVMDIFEYAKAKGLLVSLDTGWDPENWPVENLNLLRGVLKLVDIFYPNYEEAVAITGLKDVEQITDKLLEMGPKIVALKLGKEGCYVATTNLRKHFPTFKIKPLDTTGAGDVFDAAFTYGILKGWSIERTATFANAAAAIKSQHFEIKKMMPTERDVDDFLSKAEAVEE